MVNKRMSKICVICGDKASGFNFNAITCESCKAFFRRNAFKTESFHCFLGGDCNIDVLSRKYCKKCRLKKCFDIGMKTELILSEQQKQKRRKKIEENKKQKQTVITNNSESVDSSTDSLAQTLNSDSSISFEFIENDSFDCEQIDAQIVDIENYITENDNTNDVSDSVYEKAVELEFSVIRITRPISDCNAFNEIENNRLSELENAINFLKNPSARLISITNDFWEAMNILSFKCDQDIRKIIKMSKHLSAFKNSCESDKIILLKYSAIEIMVLRIILNFNYESEYWNVITDNDMSNIIPMDLLKTGKRNVYKNIYNYLQKMYKDWDSDSVVINLLTAIILFDPNRPKLKHKESVKLQQHVYMYLLQRYLQIKYHCECESKSKFLRLLNNLTDLHILNDNIAMNWVEGDPARIKPLMKEIGNRNIGDTQIVSPNCLAIEYE